MPVKQSDYEELLADYSNQTAAIALLKQHRPYLEMIPSMRRPTQSVITIPLPVVLTRQATSQPGTSQQIISSREAIVLPCDVAILMCDPEWQIKVGVEIFIFIHRPHEDFSQLLSRWRQTQVLLHTDYEWLMPSAHQHIFSEASEQIDPLFVLFPETPERIKKGLIGANLPFVIQAAVERIEEEMADNFSQGIPPK
ncbi:hypothetical protein Cri9333_4106 [Crinalium epipsammum PCC 9333]|uniref:Type IV pilin PilA n=1 Tax=Crinalium epipsammum PCC 9333 TaxID=1173022 RepID=K9W578_9CYAN|nr:hypothetical protein [Crinalium epipsammum]AFZ14907.1 hypothetical protein Cri9333_4106 [Crinalium epipsammum PCC 9333]